MSTIGDDLPLQADLREELRGRLGFPNETALLPNTQVDSLLRGALRELNRKCPLKQIGTFLTVAGQQSYQPLPADAFSVLEAWWPGLSNCGNVFSQLVNDLTSFLTQSSPVNLDAIELMISTEPAAIQIVQRQNAWLRRQLGGTARIFDRETIQLVPEPEAGGTTVVFMYTSARYATVFLVESMDEDAFWSAAEWKGHTRLSTGAGAITEVRDPEAGVVIKLDPSSHAKAATDARRAFHRSAPAPLRGGFPPT